MSTLVQNTIVESYAVQSTVIEAINLTLNLTAVLRTVLPLQQYNLEIEKVNIWNLPYCSTYYAQLKASS